MDYNDYLPHPLGLPLPKPSSTPKPTPEPKTPLQLLLSNPPGRIYMKNGTHFDADLGLDFIEDPSYYYDPATGMNYELNERMRRIEHEYGAFENWEVVGGPVLGAHAKGKLFRSGRKDVVVWWGEGVVAPQVRRVDEGAAEGVADLEEEVKEWQERYEELEGRYESVSKALKGLIQEHEELPKVKVPGPEVEEKAAEESRPGRYVECGVCGDEHFDPEESIEDCKAELAARDAAERTKSVIVKGRQEDPW